MMLLLLLLLLLVLLLPSSLLLLQAAHLTLPLLLLLLLREHGRPRRPIPIRSTKGRRLTCARADPPSFSPRHRGPRRWSCSTSAAVVLGMLLEGARTQPWPCQRSGHGHRWAAAPAGSGGGGDGV